jgi:hypothetical protein
MAEKSPVYVGVEILKTPGRLRRAFIYAALDATRELIAIGHGDRNEVLAYLGGQQRALVAINAPRRVNTGVVNQSAPVQQELPMEKPARRINARLCEYQLRQKGFTIDTTPDKAKNCPRWAQRGMDLFRRLSAFGYQPLTGRAEGPRHTLETQPDAVFWRLLGQKQPLPVSLEGRLQRQLILYDAGLPLADAMDFFLEITRYKLIQGELPDQNIHSFEELNALAAALIAWQAAHDSENLEFLGDVDEGQIVLPLPLIHN